MRQGPHQGAQKSTRTGRSDWMTVLSNWSSVIWRVMSDISLSPLYSVFEVGEQVLIRPPSPIERHETEKGSRRRSGVGGMKLPASSVPAVFATRFWCRPGGAVTWALIGARIRLLRGLTYAAREMAPLR
jgi:hypothetical protein